MRGDTMAESYEEQLAQNTYFDRHFNTDAAKILPGEYYVTQQDMMLVTVLGSCVAACIRDTGTGVGGMNHFMLPDGGTDEASPFNASARYGVYAMEILINHLLKLGARRSHLEAKVFGGGNVLRGLTVADVGPRNARFVLEFLAIEKIRVAAQDLNDVYPRKVYYYPRSGRVMMKKLRTLHNATLFEREQDYSLRLRGSKVAGAVELFG